MIGYIAFDKQLRGKGAESMATSVPRTKRRNDLEESGEMATPCKKKTTS